MKENMKKIGIIGCGTVVQKNYIRLFPKLQGIDIQYVNDVNENNAKIVASHLNARVGPVSEVLENSDYVLIATPPRFHAEYIEQAISYGVDIICEKPFVTSKTKAEELVKMAQKKNINVYVAHFRRGYPSAQLARQMISTGIIGKVTDLLIAEGGRFSWETKSDYVRQDAYGGVLFDTGSHTIDLALYSSGLDLGDFQVNVLGTSKDKPEPSHEVKAHFSLINKSRKINGQLFLSRRQILANKITITGEKGKIELSAAYQTKVRLSGENGSTLVYAEKEYRDGADCMAMLYHQIFNNGEDNIYKADRAITLTSIMEEVHKK